MTIIKLENISKTYKMGKTAVAALKNVFLEIEKGDFACLMGPSGAGKSTLLHLMGCLDTPTEGKVYFDDNDLSTLKDEELAIYRNRKIGFVFQNFGLIPVLNVYENVEYPLLIGKKRVNRSKILELIELVGLKDYIKHRPEELSGGQKQRVAIARALVSEPEVVIADEPTANLDTKTGEMIVELMLQLNRINNTTFIFSTHSELIARYSKKKVHILDGQIRGVENATA